MAKKTEDEDIDDDGSKEIKNKCYIFAIFSLSLVRVDLGGDASRARARRHTHLQWHTLNRRPVKRCARETMWIVTQHLRKRRRFLDLVLRVDWNESMPMRIIEIFFLSSIGDNIGRYLSSSRRQW